MDAVCLDPPAFAKNRQALPGARAGYKEIYDEHLFTEYEQLLFTQVVAFAEKMGKPVTLLAVPSNNPFSAVVTTAVKIGASRVYIGASEKLKTATQARLVGEAWERMDDPDKVQFDLTHSLTLVEALRRIAAR